MKCFHYFTDDGLAESILLAKLLAALQYLLIALRLNDRFIVLAFPLANLASHIHTFAYNH